MWAWVTLFNPVVVTVQESVLLSAESVKVAEPVAGVVTGFGRSFAPLRVAVNVCAVGPVPLSSSSVSHATTRASTMKDMANNLERIIDPPLQRLKKQKGRRVYSTLTVPFMNGCGTQ